MESTKDNSNMDTREKNKKIKENIIKGDVNSSLDLIAAATEQDLTDSLFLQLANETERAAGKLEKALAYAELLYQHHPERPLGFARAAEDLLALGKKKEAFKTIKKGITKHPESPLILQVAALAAKEIGKFAESVNFSQQIIDLQPNRPFGFHHAAQGLLKLQRFSECLEIIKQGIIRHPESLFLLQLGIEAARELNSTSDISLLATQLIERHPEESTGFTCMAQLHIQKDEINPALKIIKKGLQSHPKNVLLLQQGIEASLQAKRFNDSLAYSTRLITLYPNEPSGYLSQSQALIHLGREKDALQIIKDGLKKLPHDTQQNKLLIQLGIEASRAYGDISSAINFGEKLISIAPEEANGYKNLARDLIETGNIREAEKAIRTPYRLNANEQEAIKLTREFYRTIGSRKKALIFSNKLCNTFGNTEANLREELSDLFALGRCNSRRTKQISKAMSRTNDIAEIAEFLSKERPKDKPISPQLRAHLKEFDIFSHFNGNFNPIDLESTTNTEQKTILCVVHTGKCAGESVIKALQACTDPKETRICEFHIFDANIALNQALQSTKQAKHIYWIVLTRDPLTRWISAFNWDKHVFFFNQYLYGHKNFSKLFRQYRNARHLIRGLMRDKRSAFDLSHFEHLACGQMQMGQAWYLNDRALNALPMNRTSIIRTEDIEQDFKKCINSIKGRLPNTKINSSVRIEKTKNNYQLRYPALTFTKKTDLSPEETDFLRNFLQDDYGTHESLIKNYLD